MKKLNIVFFGTPDFSVPSLEALANHPRVNLKYVISMPDKKSGRGLETHSPEVIDYAKKNKIPFFQTQNINKEEEFIEKLQSEKIDAFVVLAFAQFLGEKLLALPALGAYNIHTSLLPKYRGAAPIQYALLNGDKSTGVSIQKMVKKMDAGDVCHSEPVSISSDETGGQLYTRLKFQAALSLNEFIHNLSENKLFFLPQDEKKVTIAPTLKREDGFINFKTENFKDIHNKVRALYPWPGTFCYLDKKRLKIFSVSEHNSKVEAGTHKVDGGMLLIGCLDKTIRVNELQLEGKKRSTDVELLNGLKKEFIINPEG